MGNNSARKDENPNHTIDIESIQRILVLKKHLLLNNLISIYYYIKKIFLVFRLNSILGNVYP